MQAGGLVFVKAFVWWRVVIIGACLSSSAMVWLRFINVIVFCVPSFAGYGLNEHAFGALWPHICGCRSARDDS